MARSGLLLGLAFLATGFVLACQDSTTNPLAPDSTPQFARGGGGTGRAEADVEITGGLATIPVTPETQPVNLSENRNRLHFNAGAFDIQHIDLKIDMTLTEGVGIGACEEGGNTDDQPGLAALFAKLTDGVVRSRKLFVTIDKNSLDPPSPSSDNEISVTWMEGDDKGPFDLSIRFAKGLNPTAGSPTVTLDDGDINDDEFTVTFTGGSVRLRNRTGKPRDKLSLACPNLDGVTITLERL